jgi:hypothetical protein
MLTNNYFLDPNDLKFTPEKTLHIGNTKLIKSKKYKFHVSDIKNKKFDIVNIKHVGSVFPVPKRLESLPTSRHQSARKSLAKARRSIPKRYFSVERLPKVEITDLPTNPKIKNVDDSDIYGGEDTENTQKVTSKDTFASYYKSIK